MLSEEKELEIVNAYVALRRQKQKSKAAVQKIVDQYYIGHHAIWTAIQRHKDMIPGCRVQNSKLNVEYREKKVKARFIELNRTIEANEVKKILADEFCVSTQQITVYLKGLVAKNVKCRACGELFTCGHGDTFQYCIPCRAKKYPGKYASKPELDFEEEISKQNTSDESGDFDWNELKGNNMAYYNSWNSVQNNLNPSHGNIIERKERGLRAVS